MPTEENKVELTNQETPVSEVKSEDKPVEFGSTIDQDKMAQFEAWQQQQALQEKKEALLKPLGGEAGYKSAVSKIQASGNIEFLKSIDSELREPATQATAIAKLQAFSSALDSLPKTTKEESPMFDSTLPGIGASTATPENTSSDPKISIKENVTFDGVKDPAVKNALDQMNKTMLEHNLKNPNSYKDAHLVGLKALNDAFNPLIQQSEAFKNYDRASEAMSAYSQAFAQLAELGVDNNDKTLVDLFTNAKQLAYQGDLIEKTIQSDPNARLSYKESMFSKRYK